MLVYNANKKDHYYLIGDDQYCENPRDWCNLGHFITYNKGYSPDDYDGDFVDIVKMLYGSTHIDKDECKVRVNGETYVVLPVYIYKHSYIAYSTHTFLGRSVHAEWDSGLGGLIYASAKEIREFYGVKNITQKVINDVKARFELECTDYTAYSNGECLRWDEYSFEDGVFEQVDGCGGYHNLEQILSELDISGDYEEFMDNASFELELHRRRNIERSS